MHNSGVSSSMPELCSKRGQGEVICSARTLQFWKLSCAWNGVYPYTRLYDNVGTVMKLLADIITHKRTRAPLKYQADLLLAQVIRMKRQRCARGRKKLTNLVVLAEYKAGKEQLTAKQPIKAATTSHEAKKVATA